MKITFLLPALCFLLLGDLGRCDIEADKAKCTTPLMAVATCLPFVSGGSKTPTMDCCTGFKKVAQESPDCVCILIKDRDDPSLDLHINVTLALSLPQRCKSTTAITPYDCIHLLHLAPGSLEAQMFEQLGGKSNQFTAASPSPSAHAGGPVPVPKPVIETHPTNDGGKKKRAFWLGVLASVAMAAVA